LTFDLAILGAGPAGCAAAIRAASHGLTVAVVEKARFPRDVPGEALHPDVETLFAELGVMESVVNARFIRFPGWMLDRSSERTFIPFTRSGLRFGFQAWRSQLDSILLTQAQRAGVTVLPSAGRSEIMLSGDRIVGLRTAGRQYSCRHLIDASGSSRWLSRKLGLRVRKLSPRLVAEYGYIWGDCEFGTLPEFHEHACGWTWLARVRSDCCQCVRLSLEADAGLPPLQPPFNRLTRLRGADVTWRLVQDCAGPGYFLCGDAAATLDPSASSGVARAMAAGVKAADFIADVLAREAGEEDASRAYREWLTREIATQAVQLATRYADLPQPPQWLDLLTARLTELGLSTNALESLSTVT
jgi:flavin-dependent dehydrogenase